jgi:hypothetical protein
MYDHNSLTISIPKDTFSKKEVVWITLIYQKHIAELAYFKQVMQHTNYSELNFVHMF